MKLNELTMTPKQNATRALKENYNVSLKLEKLSLNETATMLKKVRGLISETKRSKQYYQTRGQSSLMKMVFMEQALASHYSELKARHNARIIIENEEVEKSQVFLAAQDMVDTVQKMIEQVSDMLVKELPALSDSINAEIGTNEGGQFSQQTSEALKSLQDNLTQTKTALQGALNTITGQGGGMDQLPGGDMGDAGPDMGGEEAGMDGGAGPDMGGDMPPEPMDQEEPEEPPMGNVGRARR